MASCVHYDSTCVLWEIIEGLDPNITSHTITSKPFSVFDSEQSLQLHILQESHSKVVVTLNLQPNFNYSFTGGIRILSLISNDESSILHACNKLKTDQSGCIWSFTYEVNKFYSHKYEILCLFRSEQPSTQSNSKNEIIRLTSGQPRNAMDSNLESLSSDLDRCLGDKTFSDVTLKCRGRAISAHRAVLAARSPVFAAMFRNKMVKSENGTVDINDVDPDVMESFLKYVYSGKITNQSEYSLSRLVSIGDKYEVRSFQQECSNWISRCLNGENCIGFLQLANTHNDEDLKMRVVEFIVDNSDVFKTKEWSQLKKQNPELAFFVCEKYMNIP